VKKPQIVIAFTSTGYPPWSDFGVAKTVEDARKKAKKLAADLPVGGATHVVRRTVIVGLQSDITVVTFYRTAKGVRLRPDDSAIDAQAKYHKKTFRIGDRVVRNKAVGSKGIAGDLAGTVVKVTPVASGSGGTRARVRVRWDNGHEGSVEDRQLLPLD